MLPGALWSLIFGLFILHIENKLKKVQNQPHCILVPQRVKITGLQLCINKIGGRPPCCASKRPKSCRSTSKLIAVCRSTFVFQELLMVGSNLKCLRFCSSVRLLFRGWPIVLILGAFKELIFLASKCTRVSGWPNIQQMFANGVFDNQKMIIPLLCCKPVLRLPII